MTLGYQPLFRVHGATTFIPFGGVIPSVSVAVTGLAANTSYDFEVVASNSFGSTPSAVVTASTTTASGVPPPGSVGGSQTTGSVNPIVTGPVNGTVLQSATLAVTGITIADNSFVATPGVGSFTAGGHTYSISTTNNNFLVDGTSVPNGSQTSATEYYNGQVYAQDQTTGSWFTWNGTTFAAAATPPPPQFTLTVTTTTGTIAMTVSGSAVTGSGSASITYVDTLVNIQAAAVSLIFTAPNIVTSANVKVAVFDPASATNSIIIPVGIVAPVPPAPATSLVVT